MTMGDRLLASAGGNGLWLLARARADLVGEVLARLEARAGELGHETEEAAAAPGQLYDVVEGVAVVLVAGLLVHAAGLPEWTRGWLTGYGDVVRAVAAAMEDAAVQAVVLHVDSPGGEASGCFAAAEALAALRGRKPMIAICDEIAYSAAYALAAAADWITVPPTGGVGSIGAVTMHVDLSKALSEMGVKITVLAGGRHKADGHPYAPLPDSVAEDTTEQMESLRRFFAQSVVGTPERPRRLERGLTLNAALETEARAYSGPDQVAEAVRLRLADAVAWPEEAWRALQRDLAEHATKS